MNSVLFSLLINMIKQNILIKFMLLNVKGILIFTLQLKVIL